MNMGAPIIGPAWATQQQILSVTISPNLESFEYNNKVFPYPRLHTPINIKTYPAGTY